MPFKADDLFDELIVTSPGASEVHIYTTPATLFGPSGAVIELTDIGSGKTYQIAAYTDGLGRPHFRLGDNSDLDIDRTSTVTDNLLKLGPITITDPNAVGAAPLGLLDLSAFPLALDKTDLPHGVITKQFSGNAAAATLVVTLDAALAGKAPFLLQAFELAAGTWQARTAVWNPTTHAVTITGLTAPNAVTMQIQVGA